MLMLGVMGDTLAELDVDDVLLDGRRVRSELKRVMELYLKSKHEYDAEGEGAYRLTCSSR